MCGGAVVGLPLSEAGGAGFLPELPLEPGALLGQAEIDVELKDQPRRDQLDPVGDGREIEIVGELPGEGFRVRQMLAPFGWQSVPAACRLGSCFVVSVPHTELRRLGNAEFRIRGYG